MKQWNERWHLLPTVILLSHLGLRFLNIFLFKGAIFPSICTPPQSQWDYEEQKLIFCIIYTHKTSILSIPCKLYTWTSRLEVWKTSQIPRCNSQMTIQWSIQWCYCVWLSPGIPVVPQRLLQSHGEERRVEDSGVLIPFSFFLFNSQKSYFIWFIDVNLSGKILFASGKIFMKPGTVVKAYNLSYLGSGGRKMAIWKLISKINE
jgi:hypothetical protein